MKINGKVYCLFEQSGTFKQEFIKLGFQAADYDIQNKYGQTDHIIDLFVEIEKAYRGEGSIFDAMTSDDLIMAFFPCIYFCEASQLAFTYSCYNYRNLDMKQKTDKILERSKNREYFYSLIIKMFCVVQEKKLRMIVENPYTGNYLTLPQNFVMPPTMIDHNRQLRGDFFKKPTAYWFINCKPTKGLTLITTKKKKQVRATSSAAHPGICSEERSLMSPDYARNFICDFIIGKTQKYSQLNFF